MFTQRVQTQWWSAFETNVDVCKHMLLCHCVFSQLIYRYALSLRVFTANIQICSVTGQSTFCFASLGSEDLFSVSRSSVCRWCRPQNKYSHSAVLFSEPAASTEQWDFIIIDSADISMGWVFFFSFSFCNRERCVCPGPWPFNLFFPVVLSLFWLDGGFMAPII